MSNIGTIPSPVESNFHAKCWKCKRHGVIRNGLCRCCDKTPTNKEPMANASDLTVNVKSLELAEQCRDAGIGPEDIQPILTIYGDFADQLVDNWRKVKAAAIENFKQDENAGAPVVKASFRFEVDTTDKAKPKVTTKLTWSVQYADEREHEVDDPRQGKLEYIPVKP